MSNATFNNLSYLKNLPKAELHAHLNGSLCTTSIKELAEKLYGTNTSEIQALCEQLVDFDNHNLEQCFSKFRFMHELTSTQRGLRIATELVVRDFAKDNVIYLELRTTPKRTAEMSKEDYLVCVLDAITRSMKTEKIRVCLLPSIDRTQCVAEAEHTIDIALKLRSKYEDIITGIDFSGNPQVGDFDDFMPILERARKNNFKLAIHCAEIENPAEIEKMVKFGMDRCGHGTFLNENQLQELGTRNIAIECCITSNIKCRSVLKYEDHHFKRILNSKVAPVVLCTDDCGVFDTTLSEEYALGQKICNLKNSDVIKQVLVAIDLAFVNEKVKKELRHEIFKFHADWNTNQF